MSASIVTASELLAADIPAPDWIIENLLPVGVTVFAGKGKSGKSWLALELALSIAAGEPFGGFPTSQGPVLYLGLEDSDHRMQVRVRKLLGDREPDDNFECVTEWPSADDGGLAKIEEWIETMPDARVIFVDVMRKLDRVGYSYNRDAEKIEKLGKLAHRCEVAIVAVMHQYKGRALTRNVDDWMDKIQGSIGVTAAADAIWLLTRERGSDDGLLRAAGKDVPEQAIALHFDAERGKWTVADGSGAADPDAGSAERTAILAIVEAQPGISMAEIAALTGKSRETERQRLWQMTRSGQLVQLGRLYYTPEQAAAEAREIRTSPNALTP